MAGQSSQLSVKEACMMQERVQHSGSHACNNGGGGKQKMAPKAKKKEHTEAKYEPSKMEGA
jgi:hypothetical protein